MKVAASEGLTQQTKKINKRPQLAIDEAFKSGKSGTKIYVERPGHGEKTKEGSKVLTLTNLVCLDKLLLCSI